jgi:phenylalanine-4-hydroxylase
MEFIYPEASSMAETHAAQTLGVAPAVYGASQRPPRGDYSRARADYTCDQGHSAYSSADHDTYRSLCARQSALLPGMACEAFINALPQLGSMDSIPRFEDINARLVQATGWQLVGVPGLIPELPFFTLLSKRQFPVTTWMRRPDEMDYIVEPDMFHDLFGHVPLLFDPQYANHMQAYGAGALKAHGLGACELLSRLYWFSIEFGLLREKGAVRAYGAGLLSSAGELRYSVRSPEPARLPLQTPQDLVRCMATTYAIDQFQNPYFVIDSFADLLDLTAPDFTPLYAEIRSLLVTKA